MGGSSRGRTRLAETGAALCIGFGGDLVAYSTAQANPVAVAAHMSELTSVSGALGGLVAAMVHFGAVALVPPSRDRTRDASQALVEGLFSILVGAIVAHYLAAPLAAGLPFVPVSSSPVVGFGLGVFAWQTAPAVIGGVRLAVSPKRVARALLQALSKWAGPGEQP